MKKQHSKKKKISHTRTLVNAFTKKKEEQKKHPHQSLASYFGYLFKHKRKEDGSQKSKQEKYDSWLDDNPHAELKTATKEAKQDRAAKKIKQKASHFSFKERFSHLLGRKETQKDLHLNQSPIGVRHPFESRKKKDYKVLESKQEQSETVQKPAKTIQASDKTASNPKTTLKEAKPGMLGKITHKAPKVSIKEILSNLFKKKDKGKHIVHARKHQLRFYLERAGILTSPQKISRRIFDIAVAINLLISSYVIYYYSSYVGYNVFDLVLVFLLLWSVVLAGIIALFWIFLYLYLDLKIFKRKVEIEEVLPDYLQLTASNIKAGMTIDRALWYAVRPRFGVLAYEIEVVAKETMKGIDLKVALEHFSNKYDSAILKRSISLLIEGIESGGEIGTLLNKISINIQENKIMKREMAANVTTYVIFISFATIAAAPALFALSGVLIKVISSIGTSLGEATAATSGMGFFISFSGSGIAYSDFKIFAIVSLVISSFFSSMIIATIMKGSVKHGFKYIPMFVAATITIFLIADFILGKLVSLVT